MFGRSRLALGVGAGLTVGFLALIVIVGTTIWLVERGNSLFEQSALQRTIRIAAVELRDHLRTAESSQRGFLLTGNQIYLAPYDTAKTRARQELDVLGRMIAPEPPTGPCCPGCRKRRAKRSPRWTAPLP